MRENLKSGSMRGGWRGGNSPDQSPTLLPLGPPICLAGYQQGDST